MMAYATVNDVQSRMSRELSVIEQTVCATMLDDAAVIIDAYNSEADAEAKKVVSCRMVIRAIGDGTDQGTPIGATQGSMTAGGYTQSWTVGNGGGSGELYLGRTEKMLLGSGNSIGSYSPTQELVVNCLD
jgi:hypothetical protein